MRGESVGIMPRRSRSGAINSKKSDQVSSIYNIIWANIQLTILTCEKQPSIMCLYSIYIIHHTIFVTYMLCEEFGGFPYIQYTRLTSSVKVISWWFIYSVKFFRCSRLFLNVISIIYFCCHYINDWLGWWSKCLIYASHELHIRGAMHLSTKHSLQHNNKT